MRVTANQKKEVLALRKQGKTYKAISLFTSVPQNIVAEIIKKAGVKQ